MKRVVLAYSGGLDTSVAIPWLAEQGWDVIAVAVDVGQGEDLETTVKRAELLGAAEARLEDVCERFVEGYVVPALHMNALYQNRYPLVSALSRPLISEVLVQVARETGASAIAHGCTGKGNDQVRFEASLSSLDPDMEVLAPIRDWDMTRAETISYAEERSLPINTTRSSPYSIDANLWGRSIECGILEDPWIGAPEDIFESTSVRPGAQPSTEVEVGFEAGVPATLDGRDLGALDVITELGAMAGGYGFGRIDMIEDRLVGIKSREVYEAPAALALIAAHVDLEAMTLERSLAAEKRRLEPVWAELVYKGLWFSPLRDALDSFARTSQRPVSGVVRMRMGPGVCSPVGRRSGNSLYNHSLATYGEGDAFSQDDAAAFTRLWSLPTTEWARVTRTDR
ncbi:MAG: argininosuccinate synthase [Actinomycetota bacterium]|nr:argininosuccinate synthase [Actinomycetota bacterium]